MPQVRHRGGHAASFQSHVTATRVARISGDVMGRVSRIFLAGTVLATFIPLASFDVARADPAMRLAQAPLTPEQQRELEEQKKKAPAARPPAPAQPPAVQAPKPPGPPAQVPPAGPAQRPAQTAPQPPAAPG